MEFKLISQLGECYDVVSYEDDIITVEANHKNDFSFKTEIENICKMYSEKTGDKLSPKFDINDSGIFFSTIKTNLHYYGDTMDALMDKIKETVELWTSDYIIGLDDDYEQIIIEVPTLREDAPALHELKKGLNKLDFYNGNETLGVILEKPYNDLIAYPNRDVLKIDYTKSYTFCNGNVEY